MKIVGIENIICDYYLWENEIYINGGGTICNILVNLDHFQIPSKLIGYIGNDEQGKWIINSLKTTKIDLNDIKIAEDTKCFFIEKKGYSSTCPICHKKKKRYPSLNIKKLQDKINEEDIILIKDYSKTNEKIIKQFNTNSILIDMGYIKPLLYLEKEVLKKFIIFPFFIMSIKEEVLEFIKNRLSLTKEELIQKMNTEFLIITKGKKGAELIYQKKDYSFQLENPLEELETNGCGDAFFSIIIKEFLKKELRSEEELKDLFLKASDYVSIVLKNIGARNHILKNGKVINYQKCLCKKIKIQ